ncbi:hypothetical protein M0804_008209 [Polistes exclamans]|nr:hypothetical protein M0804_008209 [Polistes exclamans]
MGEVTSRISKGQVSIAGHCKDKFESLDCQARETKRERGTEQTELRTVIVQFGRHCGNVPYTVLVKILCYSNDDTTMVIEIVNSRHLLCQHRIGYVNSP